MYFESVLLYRYLKISLTLQYLKISFNFTVAFENQF
jgi:hypothetical protein